MHRPRRPAAAAPAHQSAPRASRSAPRAPLRSAGGRADDARARSLGGELALQLRCGRLRGCPLPAPSRPRAPPAPVLRSRSAAPPPPSPPARRRHAAQALVERPCPRFRAPPLRRGLRRQVRPRPRPRPRTRTRTRPCTTVHGLTHGGARAIFCAQLARPRPRCAAAVGSAGHGGAREPCCRGHPRAAWKVLPALGGDLGPVRCTWPCEALSLG